MTRPDGGGERVSLGLARLVREATEATEAERRSSMEARRRDLAARQRLGAAIAAPPRRALAVGWRSFAAAGLAAAVLVGVAARTFRDDALTYSVAGAREAGGYVRAGEGPATVTFEDGSEIVFAPGSAGRVGETTAHGGRIALEDGSVDVRIVKLPGAEWALRAGPWEVQVIGTAFRLAWDARARSLRVDLHEGKVAVRGPGAEEGVGLRAGQSLEASEVSGLRLTSTASASAAAAEPPPPVAAASPTGSPAAAPPSGSAADVPAPPRGEPGAEAPPAGAPPAGASPGAAKVTWSARVSRGEFDAVLAEADERGIDAVLATASAPDLVALGDAARYRGRSGVASRSLKALRDRFAGTAAAANAAFLLGRMADDGGSAAAAIRWYDVHMAEGGAFATEALGRKMLAVRRTQGDAAAAVVARQYLARHPKGPHAVVAKSLVGGESGANDARPPR